jgi:hypothetical protein
MSRHDQFELLFNLADSGVTRYNLYFGNVGRGTVDVVANFNK